MIHLRKEPQYAKRTDKYKYKPCICIQKRRLQFNTCLKKIKSSVSESFAFRIKDRQSLTKFNLTRKIEKENNE